MFVAIPFITAVLAWFATIGGMVLILRYSKKKVSAWFTVTSSTLAIAATITCVHLVYLFWAGV